MEKKFSEKKVNPSKSIKIQYAATLSCLPSYINELLTHTFHSSVCMQKTRLTSFINSPNQNYQPKFLATYAKAGLRVCNTYLYVYCANQNNQPRFLAMKQPTNFSCHEKPTNFSCHVCKKLD